MAEVKEKASIPVWLVGSLITLFITGLTAWGTTQTRITILEVQMKNGDIDRGRIENKIDKMLQKQDRTDESIYEIKTIINNKADK